MMGALKFLTKRPSDKTIRISKFVFGLILIISLYYNLIYQGDSLENNFFWQEINENQINYIKYFLVAIGIVPLVTGAFDLNFLKSKYTRIFQIIAGIFLFYISSKIIETPNIDIDILLFLMAFFPFLGGISGKIITKKGLKYGQKITKIRV